MHKGRRVWLPSGTCCLSANDVRYANDVDFVNDVGCASDVGYASDFGFAFVKNK